MEALAPRGLCSADNVEQNKGDSVGDRDPRQEFHTGLRRRERLTVCPSDYTPRSIWETAGMRTHAGLSGA